MDDLQILITSTTLQSRSSESGIARKVMLAAANSTFPAGTKENVSILQGLTLEDLNRIGTFENAGEVSLERVIRMMREHDAEHLNELRDLLQE